MARYPYRGATRSLYVGPLVVSLGCAPRRRLPPDVAGNRRGWPRAITRASLQQYAQKLQRHYRPPGHGGLIRLIPHCRPSTASKTKAVQDRSTKLGINCLLHLGPQRLFVCIASNIDNFDAVCYYRDQGNDCMLWQG